MTVIAALLSVILVGAASGQQDSATAPPGGTIPAVRSLGLAGSDTFAHPIHKGLPCLGCHLSTTGARLTFTPPLGCRSCHHGASHREECGRCHEVTRLPDSLPVRFAVAAAGKAPRERLVAFPHRRHTDLACTSCHGETPDRAPVDSAARCLGCHEKHHDVGRACAVCHRREGILATHAPPVRPHVACDACHATAVIARFTPTRSFCLACHGPEVDHRPGQECTVCHLQATPTDYRPKLVRALHP